MMSYDKALVKAVVLELIVPGDLKRLNDYCRIHRDERLITTDPSPRRCRLCIHEELGPWKEPTPAEQRARLTPKGY